MGSEAKQRKQKKREEKIKKNKLHASQSKNVSDDQRKLGRLQIFLVVLMSVVAAVFIIYVTSGR